MNKRLQWTSHRGQKVLQIDLRNFGREEQLETAEAYAKLLGAEPEGSVRILVMGGGGFEFHPDLLPKVKAQLLQVQSKVKRSALVGFDGILKVAIDGFFTLARFLGMTVNDDRGRHFDREDEALEWLVK